MPAKKERTTNPAIMTLAEAARFLKCGQGDILEQIDTIPHREMGENNYIFSKDALKSWLDGAIYGQSANKTSPTQELSIGPQDGLTIPDRQALAHLVETIILALKESTP